MIEMPAPGNVGGFLSQVIGADGQVVEKRGGEEEERGEGEERGGGEKEGREAPEKGQRSPCSS